MRDDMSIKRRITVGIDIGSTTSKAVVVIEGIMASSFIGNSTTNPTKTARIVCREALDRAGLQENAIDYIVGTGYGRAKVDFANENVSEISCHAKGAHFLLPNVRTIIDIGGQDTKAISIDKQGQLLEFAMNDKCAAGTGRFLDFISRSMGMEIDDMARLHFENGVPALISSMCSVFAESEVINLINENVPLPSIVKGLHRSVAGRISTLARRVGLSNEIVISGGVAKNNGVVDALTTVLGCTFVTFPRGIDPQIVGALGAAIIASEKV